MIKMALNNKGIGIIAAIMIILIASVMGIVVTSLLGTGTFNSLNYMYSQQAFFIAEGGLEYYLEQLENQASSWVTPPTRPADEALGIGTFTITTANEQAGEIDITSTAHITGPYGQTVQRVVTTHVTRLSGPDNPPEAFSYASYIRLQANLQNSTNGKVIGALGAEKWIHAWENFDFYDVDTWDPDNPPAPIADPVGEGYVNEQMDDIFPYLGESGFASYRADADTVVDGNYTFAEGQTYSGLYYITGTVTIEDNVTINGGIVSNGTINMRHSTGSTITPASGQPALITDSNIDMSNADGIQITGNGVTYCEQGLNLQNAENCTLVGTVIVSQNLNVKNTDNITLQFNWDVVENPPPHFPAEFRATTWDEVY